MQFYTCGEEAKELSGETKPICLVSYVTSLTFLTKKNRHSVVHPLFWAANRFDYLLVTCSCTSPFWTTSQLIYSLFVSLLSKGHALGD